MSILEIRVPDIGGHSDVNVAEVYVKVGDTVNIDDNPIMLETDKATMEVPADKAGVITEMLVKVGSKINEGDVILKVEAAGSATAAASPAAQSSRYSRSCCASCRASSCSNSSGKDGEIVCDVMVLGAGHCEVDIQQHSELRI